MPPLDVRRSHLAAALLLVLHACLAWAARSMTGIGTNEDGAIYVLLGRALRHGHYASEYLAGAPPHTLYPPGFPAALGVWSLLGTGVDWLLVLPIASSVVALGLVYAVCRRRLDPTLSLVVLAALAVNPYLVQKAGRLFSEAPYVALSVGALWATTLETRRSAWAAGALAVAAALTRSVGITILPAVALMLLLRKRFRALAVFVVASAITVGGWQVHALRTTSRPAERSYADDFREAGGSGEDARRASTTRIMVRRVAANAKGYAWSTAYHLPMPSVPGTPLDNIAALAIGLGGVALGVPVLLRAWPAAVAYLVCYVGLLLVWLGPVGRFLDPLTPLLVAAFVSGWSWLGRRGGRAPGSRLAVAAGLVLVVTGAVGTTRLIGTVGGCERGQTPPHAGCVVPEQDSYLRAAVYLRDSVPADALVLSARPGITYYYGQRRTVPSDVRALPDSERLLPALRNEGVSYIVLGSVHRHDTAILAPKLERICASIAVGKAFPPYTYVLDLTREPLDGGDACAALALYGAANRDQDFVVPP